MLPTRGGGSKTCDLRMKKSVRFISGKAPRQVKKKAILPCLGFPMKKTSPQIISVGCPIRRFPPPLAPGPPPSFFYFEPGPISTNYRPHNLQINPYPTDVLRMPSLLFGVARACLFCPLSEPWTTKTFLFPSRSDVNPSRALWSIQRGNNPVQRTGRMAPVSMRE